MRDKHSLELPSYEKWTKYRKQLLSDIGQQTETDCDSDKREQLIAVQSTIAKAFCLVQREIPTQSTILSELRR